MSNQKVIMLILKENGGTEKNWQLIFYAAKIKDTFKLADNDGNMKSWLIPNFQFTITA